MKTSWEITRDRESMFTPLTNLGLRSQQQALIGSDTTLVPTNPAPCVCWSAGPGSNQVRSVELSPAEPTSPTNTVRRFLEGAKNGADLQIWITSSARRRNIFAEIFFTSTAVAPCSNVGCCRYCLSWNTSGWTMYIISGSQVQALCSIIIVNMGDKPQRRMSVGRFWLMR